VTPVPPPASATATLAQAREHARSLAGDRAATGPTIPASAASGLPASVAPGDVLWDETVGVGGYASRRVPRGTFVRFEDPEGDACLSLLVYNAHNPAERLNVADTVKVQWQAYLGPGALLLSDMGRVLLTVVADTSARHDCLCGGSNRRTNELRYGDGSASGPAPSSRDLLALGAAKHGLGRVDLPPAINLFKGAPVGADGSVRFAGTPLPGAHVELRAELDVLVVLSNTPHPLDDRPAYTVTPVRCTAWRAPRAEDDAFRASTPERRRAFENNGELLHGAGDRA
jgi:urea carboxylase-associated protein 2